MVATCAGGERESLDALRSTWATNIQPPGEESSFATGGDSVDLGHAGLF